MNWFGGAGRLAMAVMLLFLVGHFLPTLRAQDRGGGMMGGYGMGRGMMGGGGMMQGVVPPGVRPSQLPEPRSRGARLLREYCQQCHNLPSPAMHNAGEWPGIVRRMNQRMQRMSGMMHIAAPTRAELDDLVDYLQRNAQQPLQRSRYPDLNSREGRAFSATCSQCHALPDPGQHTAQEWPGVVARMKQNERVMGRRVPGAATTAQIIEFLQRHAR